MAAHIPPGVRSTPHPTSRIINEGKVRDTESVRHGNLLPVVSDRISIFDFLLNGKVPRKGEVLNALSIFWKEFLGKRGISHDLIAYGKGIDFYLAPCREGDRDLYGRATVIRSMQMDPVELIVRGYLTGSGWKAYRETGSVCGHTLPGGLWDGAKLPNPIFTPTTKATVGHDEHWDVAEVRNKFPHGEELILAVYKEGTNYAFDRGIIIADTKGEASGDRLGDEVLTPDSSRFWLREEWEEAAKQKKSPPSHDKQFVRNWGISVGIDKLEPKDPEHRKIVDDMEVPREVLEKTSEIYLDIFRRLVGCSLDEYQSRHIILSGKPEGT